MLRRLAASHLELGPAQLEGGRHESVLYRKRLRVQLHRLDELREGGGMGGRGGGERGREVVGGGMTKLVQASDRVGLMNCLSAAHHPQACRFDGLREKRRKEGMGGK